MTQRIDITVAAVIEREQRFLIVEEEAGGQVVFNQPAGHLEPGESLLDAVIRETYEESGFKFSPSALLGIYLWQSLESGASFLRVAFCGGARAPTRTPSLDDGILATHWLTRRDLANRSPRLRSPMVLRCIDDYQAGARYPLECLTDLGTEPESLLRLAR